VERSLAEDLGRAGDITSIATIPAGTQARAVVVARNGGTISGLPLVAATFRRLAPDMDITASARDGDTVATKTDLMTVVGDARAVLAAERAALNMLGHLSGIATATAAFVRLLRARARASAAPARRRRACVHSKNTPCAAAAASTTASVSTTRC
jgi:nicotinate-nucleotide pyrophosphorylase (carboxylating)